jgi:DNA-binding LacI/PurR family transcriptional regulator
MLAELNLKYVTLKDIAKRVGVSKSAISMALRNSHQISLERRREIQRVARQMGYAPDPFFSGLAAHRRGRVPLTDHGILAWVNHWDKPGHLRRFKEFNAYWQGASAAATRFGYRLDEVRWEAGCSPKRFERILLARGIEGVLIPPHNELLNWEDFDWNKFSAIRFGMSVQNPDSNLVTADVFRAVVMAIEKIYHHGYRRIGITVNEAFNERLGGTFLSGYYYAQALLNLKPALPPLLTVLTVRDAADLERQKILLRQWLTRHQPDAILTADIELPALVRELGLRVPQDLAMAGTSTLDIPLTAGVDQHSEAVGRIAVEMLVKQINVNERGEPRDPVRILVESRWQDGSSLPAKV